MKNGNQKTIQLRVRYFEWSQIPLFLEPGGVCQLLGGITQQTLINWEKERGLPVEHISRSTALISKYKLMEWIENGYKPLSESAAGDELPGLRVV